MRTRSAYTRGGGTRPPGLFASLFLGGFVVAATAGGTGCGGTSAPSVDPRPLSDAGIPDRTILEGGGGETGGDARDAGADGGTPSDAGAVDLAVDAVGDGDGDGGADAMAVPTTLTMTINEPVEGGLVVAARRFAPLVAITVMSAPGASDDVKQTDAELWSTGAMPAKISSTRLSLLARADTDMDGGAADTTGATDADDDAGRGSTTLPPTLVTNVVSFGDTPIDLSSLATGTYQLRVLASTLSGSAVTVTRTFRVDAGPTIRVVSPTPDQASRGSILVSVEVVDPFSATPPTVQVSVANIPIPSLVVSGTSYQATVSETIATPSLSGEQLLDVGAVNAAGVAARHVVVRFVFDDLGPTIANGKPATGSLMGGIVKIEADVTDPAGVDPNTVVAVVGHGDSTLEVKLDRDGTDPKHFSHLFDTRRLSDTVLYPTISFRASDVPGNQSNVGYTVAVDNTPPLSDLDPPADLRVRRNVNGNWRCSWRFDPLGSDAVNDGDSALQLFDIRARVEDQGNAAAAGGADITPLAGLDPAHVELLVLDDTNRALVVDTDGDGLCDAINPRLVPTTTPMSSDDALLINMAPVPPTGSADFTLDTEFPAAGFPDCAIGNDSLRPTPLCRTSDLTIAIPAQQTTSAAVWTIPNVLPGTLQCVGNQFDSLGNHVKDGPACLAVHAIDRLGNSQVSRILHVCVDHDGDGAECPFAAVASVSGGTPVQVTTATPHGLVTGARVLLSAVPGLSQVNGLWTVTVVGGNTFTLNGSTVPVASTSAGGRYMPWTSASDCSGRQTATTPVIVVDDATACRPWRRFSLGEHLEIN